MNNRPLLDRLSPDSVHRLQWWLIAYIVTHPDEVTAQQWEELGRIRINRPKIKIWKEWKSMRQ